MDGTAGSTSPHPSSRSSAGRPSRAARALPTNRRRATGVGALVRRQAATLFVDAFPLQDPDASNEDLDACLQRQFTAIGELLADADPGVRVVAVAGSCRVLSVFWELIPQGTCRALLTVRPPTPFFT